MGGGTWERARNWIRSDTCRHGLRARSSTWTASSSSLPHEKAWRESLRELMQPDWRDTRDREGWTPEAFTSRVYQEELSGKPRMSGPQPPSRPEI